MVDIEYIFPTHTCFDDSLDLLCAILRHTPHEAPNLRLVHGIVAPYGQPMAHAWVEADDSMVLFVALHEDQRVNLKASKAEYYADIRVRETFSYTPQQALQENRLSGHYGPWEEKLQRLCRRRAV